MILYFLIISLFLNLAQSTFDLACAKMTRSFSGKGIGIRLINGGGGGLRYTRIPDPAHVLSVRGWVRGKERKADNHRLRGPIENVYSHA
jgi:hypothetical protein